MKICSFKDINYTKIKEKDETGRDIGYTILEDCVITGRNCFYPNVLIYSKEKLISPYDEKIMSLNKDSFYEDKSYEFNICSNVKVCNEEVFFFIYNFDNYYHFVYDTLPYLYTFLKLKKTFPNLKLLINYPNVNKKEFYKFNLEFLEKFVNKDDLIIFDKIENTFKKIFISSSLTHYNLNKINYSNNPPREEIYKLYKNIKISSNSLNGPKKIYISRRTWINKDLSNIGTNYTMRRKMMNEDLLVEELINLGFVEIFTENLSTDEKINLFRNAEIIVGCCGGGMTNLLFSNENVKSIIIETPYFLEINKRFIYSCKNLYNTIFNDVKIYKEENEIPLYCRVKLLSPKYLNKIGEIMSYDNYTNKYLINISNNDVSGFNNEILFENEYFYKDEFELLDLGLNSPFSININNFLSKLKN